jgi:hypothetical protein
MKSKDLQNVVLSKYNSGDHPRKIFRDLNGGLAWSTVRRWCKMISDSGVINLSKPPGSTRTVRTKAAIQKVKHRLKRKRKVSQRILAKEMKMSKTSAHRIIVDDLHYRPYKIIQEPALTDDQKQKRKQFAHWVKNNFNKNDISKWLFSDEKMFDIDGVYNSQNDRIWAATRADADARGGVKKKRKFPTKVMVWLGACSAGLTPLVILDNGSVNHEIYIKDVLPVALKFGNKMLGDYWTYQQDGATAHTHHLTQEWCDKHFPSFISKDRWPPNSPDLNPLDYCIWNELVQAMDWDRVKTKQTLIEELKRSVKKIKQKIVLESCNDFSKRLYRLLRNDGKYLR